MMATMSVTRRHFLVLLEFQPVLPRFWERDVWDPCLSHEHHTDHVPDVVAILRYYAEVFVVRNFPEVIMWLQKAWCGGSSFVLALWAWI